MPKVPNISSLAGSISILALSNLAAHLVVVLSIPIITRYYSPESYGYLASFLAATMFLSHIMTMKYELAIPIAKEKDSSNSLVALSSLILFGMGSVFLLVTYYAPSFSEWVLLKFKSVGFSTHKLAVILILASMASAILHILKQVCIRDKKIVSLAASNVTRVIATVLFQLLAVFFAADNFMLLLSVLVGFAAAAIILVPQCKPICNNEFNLKQAASLHKDFPLFTLPATALNSFSTALIPVLILISYDAQVSGYYGMALRLLGIPMALLGMALNLVFLAKFSEFNKSNNYKASASLIKKYVFFHVTILFPIYILCWFLTPYIIPVFLGQEWAPLSLYIQIILPWSALQFLSSPISSYVIVKLQNRKAALVGACEFTLRMLAFYTGFFVDSSFVSILLYSLSGCLISIIYTFWILNLSGAMKDRRFLKSNALRMLCILLSFFLMWVLYKVFSELALLLTFILTVAQIYKPMQKVAKETFGGK